MKINYSPIKYIILFYIEQLSYGVSVVIFYHISIFIFIPIYHIINFSKLLAKFLNNKSLCCAFIIIHNILLSFYFLHFSLRIKLLYIFFLMQSMRSFFAFFFLYFLFIIFINIMCYYQFVLSFF